MATQKKKTPNKRTPKPKTTDSLVLQAIKNKASVEVIRETQEIEIIQKRENTRLSYISAMKDFQNELPDLLKTRQGQDKNGKKYNYAPLPEIRKAIQPLLFKYGFVYRWDFRSDGGNKLNCTCILTHIDGHYECASITAEWDDTENMNAIQSVGSTRTYLQRYTLIAVLGLATADEDNDGATSTSKKETIPGPEAISEEREELERLELEELTLKIDKKILEKFILDNWGEKALKEQKFSISEKNEIKKFIIDTIINNKNSDGNKSGNK